MKSYHCLFIFAATFAAAPLIAQQNPGPARPAARGNLPATNSTGGYATDIVVVSDAQQQALDQARQQLQAGGGNSDHTALDTAIKEMERAQTALEAAKKSPDKLPAAIAAEQAAYQALLKATPREFNIQRSRNGSQNQSGNPSGQPNQRQLDQLDMTQEQNRYETERQAAAPPNAQQREQTQVADRLKELAQRQQDLNERVREFQTTLQSARTDQEREDIQRQLKRLSDEERQMLASMDEMRQQIAQSPNATAQSDTQQKLDQTRQDMQRASEELQNQSASSALAAGTRAQQAMQNLREDLRKQTSSEFSEQMRQLRNEVRDMVNQEKEIARGLDSLKNDEHQSLDDSAQRQQIVQQMAAQQSKLTNLLAGMRNVTEQAETTEPLLSKQLYDTLRRADQMHTDNLLDMGSQLTDRGFLPQASQAERAAGTNITELAASVERAADSVLSSEADALRYAQKQLDDLTRQVEREIGGTNAPALAAGGTGSAEDQSNRLSRAQGGAAVRNAAGNRDTNGIAGANGRAAGNESQTAANNSQNPQSQQRGEGNSPNAGQNGNRGQQPNGTGNNGEQASAGSQPGGQGGQGEEGTAGNNGQRGNRGGNQQQANNNSPGRQNNPPQRGEAGEQSDGRNGSGANGNQVAQGGSGGSGDGLRQFVQQLGRGNRNQEAGGPITGNNYVNWADQLRDVEQVVDSPDLRNQLATVRERASILRGEYRDNGRKPDEAVVREQILVPLTQVRVWLQEELARQENASSLVPLDRDPVPDNYSQLVRTYYEKLGSAQ
jgi:hypothetical protein